MKLIVDRSIWARGKGNYKTAQDLQFGNKFDIFMLFGFELGYTLNDFLVWPESLTPLHVSVKTKKNLWPKELVHNNLNTKLCIQIMKINDSDKIDDIKREILLKEKFKRLNIDIKYVGNQEEIKKK
jgi:hypothetical protein